MRLGAAALAAAARFLSLGAAAPPAAAAAALLPLALPLAAGRLGEGLPPVFLPLAFIGELPALSYGGTAAQEQMGQVTGSCRCAGHFSRPKKMIWRGGQGARTCACETLHLSTPSSQLSEVPRLQTVATAGQLKLIGTAHLCKHKMLGIGLPTCQPCPRLTCRCSSFHSASWNSALRSDSVCSTLLPSVRPQRCARRWM